MAATPAGRGLVVSDSGANVSRRRGRAIARHAIELALSVLVMAVLGSVVLGRVVPMTGHPVFVVAGGSMEPAIGRGAAVVLEPVAAGDIRVGDVVSLRSGGAVFTHRVIRVATRSTGTWIETKGDANESADPSLTRATDVIGRVTVVVPAIGYLLALLSRGAGVILVVSLGLILGIAGWLLDPPRVARRHPVATSPPAAASEPSAG